jgi:hypothetical protein
VAARFITGADEGESVTYRDEDTTNLTHANLHIPEHRGNGKTSPVDYYYEIMGYVPEMRDELLGGSAAQKHLAANELLHQAFERMQEERQSLAL